jgi:hypothetical protein
MNSGLLSKVMLAILVVASAIFAFVNFQNKEQMMSYKGVVKLDTASYEDLKLNNAIYIDYSDAPSDRLYLRFKDNQTPKDVIGNQVRVFGRKETSQLDNGEFIWELRVNDVEYAIQK